MSSLVYCRHRSLETLTAIEYDDAPIGGGLQLGHNVGAVAGQISSSICLEHYTSNGWLQERTDLYHPKPDIALVHNIIILSLFKAAPARGLQKRRLHETMTSN